MIKLLFLYLFIQYVSALDNQNKSINTTGYDCIVKFKSDRATCTGAFIFDNVLITAQHCIPKNLTDIHINNTSTSDYRSSNNDEEEYDIGYIKFNNFRYSCSSYFDILYNLSIVIDYPLDLIGCGYGESNLTDEQTEFGCKDFRLALSLRSDFNFNKGISVLPGSSGSPIFSPNNMTIYAILHSSDHSIGYEYSYIASLKHFNNWYFSK